jgi:transposase
LGLLPYLLQQQFHCEYNPVERCWATIEKHWNGYILDSVEKAIKICENIVWKSNKTIVKIINKK